LGTLEHKNEKTYPNAILDNTNLGYMKRCHRFKHCQELLTLGTHLKLVYGSYNSHQRMMVGRGSRDDWEGGGWGIERKKKGLV
jgi:hypothetical protein